MQDPFVIPDETEIWIKSFRQGRKWLALIGPVNHLRETNHLDYKENTV
jgi:hypothetical protein